MILSNLKLQYSNLIELSSLSCSDENDFVPLSSLFNMKFRVKNNIYYAKIISNKIVTSKSIRFFFTSFINESFAVKKFFYPEIQHFYYTCLGDLYIIDNKNSINYLILTCVKSNKISDIKIGENDPSNFVIFINKKFKTDHSKLYLYFKKNFIDTSDLDFIFTDNIDKYCFNPVKFQPAFDSFEQLEKFNESIKTQLNER